MAVELGGVGGRLSPAYKTPMNTANKDTLLPNIAFISGKYAAICRGIICQLGTLTWRQLGGASTQTATPAIQSLSESTTRHTKASLPRHIRGCVGCMSKHNTEEFTPVNVVDVNAPDDVSIFYLLFFFADVNIIHHELLYICRSG